VHTANLHPIARVHSPYKEKFGIPRQPGLVNVAEGYLEMLPPYHHEAAFVGIEGFSHLWIIFGFHACQGKSNLRVRPPRLGGNQTIGVFASRSPFRPNHLGLSVLRLLRTEYANKSLHVHVGGLDLLDGTPVYDIKPYVPYADNIEDASGGFAADAPQPRLPVIFSTEAQITLQNTPQWRDLIEQTLRLDPRPAYQRGQTTERRYGMRIADLDVRWRMDDDKAYVEAIHFITCP
jgi:tRNA-Thr(GGU) m(6)t(6)A37 methyltransferase TsaA